MFAGWQYVAVFATATMSATALTPVLRKWARRLSILDSPDGTRKLQAQPIPYLGGIAITVSASVVVLVAAIIHDDLVQDLPLLVGVLIPAVVLAGIGLLDDIRGLTPLPRFLIQSIAGFVTATALAITGTGAQISDSLVLNVGLTVVWVIGVTNAINLLDNTDGVASGTAAIAALALAAIALVNGQHLVSGLGLVLAGACLGFWFWNRFPATIYMGDSGSLFIGFMLAAIAIRIDLEALPHAQALSVPLLVLLVPIFDTTLVVISRLRRGLSPFIGGLDHVAHRIRRLGLNVSSTAQVIWGLAVSTGIAALLVSQAPPELAAFLIGICGVTFVVGLWLALRLPDTGDLP